MKILMCTSEYPPEIGGFANVAFNLKQQFEKKGHEVKIFKPNKPLGSGIKILNYWKEVWKTLNEKSFLESFDVIWCQNPLFLKINYSDKFVDKLVCTIHTTYNGRWEHMPEAIWPKEILRNIYYRWMNIKEKKAFECMKDLKFITTTKQTKKELKDLGVDCDIIIPNGIITEEFKPNGIKKEQVCATARMVPWKGIDKLIDVFNELGYPLKIAGIGPLFNKLKQKANSNIQFLGELNKKEIIKLYQESKAFTSASKYEGMPLSLLEAMSCGCVPLVSPIPGHTEVTEKLGNEENPEKIHQFMKENYDWNIIANKYLEVFNEK